MKSNGSVKLAQGSGYILSKYGNVTSCLAEMVGCCPSLLIAFMVTSKTMTRNVFSAWGVCVTMNGSTNTP